MNQKSDKIQLAYLIFFGWIFRSAGVPAAVQVESLQCYAFLCSLSQDKWQIELLAEFPSVLVPLAGDNQVWSFVSVTLWPCVYFFSFSANWQFIIVDKWLSSVTFFAVFFLRKCHRLKWFVCIFWIFFQTIRVAAMNCIDSLRTLWCHVERSGKKNGTLLSE